LAAEGIREAVVVIGHQGEQVRRALQQATLETRLWFVENAHFDLKNGVSLLAAAKYVDRECILSMADHLYSPELLRRLLRFDLPKGASVLGVDYDIERCFDLEDATKIRLRSGRITDIGKDIGDYNCIDTGVFRVGPELIEALASEVRATGDCSLSDGVRALAAQGRFYGCDVGDSRWIDIDTPAAFQKAEAMVHVFGDSLDDDQAEVSNRGGEAMEFFAPSWVRSAKPYREDHFQLASARKGLSRMMSNESPFSPSPRVIEAIVQAARQGNLYPTSGLELRRRLGEREGLGEAQVVLGAGSTELIDLVVRTFVAPEEEVVISVPTFSMYEARACVAGGVAVLVPMTDGHEFDVAGVIGAVSNRTKVIFLCTPNNPTGSRLTEASVRRILRLGFPTAIDEAYYELGETPESLAHLVAEFPNAILLRTFSKAFGLAGLRLGYALAHPAVARLLMRAKIPWNISSLTLAAAMAVLDDMHEVEHHMGELRHGRGYLELELAKIRGVSVISGEGNFVLLDVAATGTAAEAIVESMVGEGVLIRSLSVHHAKRSYVRVTVGTREQNHRCVEAMRAVVTRLGRRTGAAVAPGVSQA
jgi:histidinol-phosphate aminotransferase